MDITVANLISNIKTINDFEKLSTTEQETITRCVCFEGKTIDKDSFITRIEYCDKVFSVHFISGIVDIDSVE